MKLKEFNEMMKDSFGDRVISIPSKTMKVKIMQRSVYHKYTEMEIEIPNNIKAENIQDYIMSIEEKWVDVLDNLINQTEFVFGSGLYDIEGMEDAEADSEWRYDCKELKIGGHL